VRNRSYMTPLSATRAIVELVLVGITRFQWDRRLIP
jgi:hypothetical protein